MDFSSPTDGFLTHSTHGDEINNENHSLQPFTLYRTKTHRHCFSGMPYLLQFPVVVNISTTQGR